MPTAVKPQRRRGGRRRRKRRICETSSERGSPSNVSRSVDGDVVPDRDSCDAVIRVDGESFPINKLHLSTCSPYFKALLLSWSTSDTKVFKIQGLSSDMMRLIFDFADSGLVTVTEDNVQELFLAANYLLVTRITQTCSNFLQEQLGPENCIGIWKFTDICSLCPELRCRAYQCITDNFEEVVSSVEFQQLTVQDLTDLLIRDDLSIRESRLFDAILQWIAHAAEERRGHLTVLLSKVRLALMGDIRRLKSNKFLWSNKESLQIVRKALRFKHQMDQNSPPLTFCCNPLARPRLPKAILLTIGDNGYWQIEKRIDAYDVSANCWVNGVVPQWPSRVYHSTAVLQDYIYCVGGTDGKGDLKSVVRFDMKTHTWQDAAPMHERRHNSAIAVLNGYLYVMGGERWSFIHRTAERYCPDTNQWSLIASMNEKRSRSSCTALNNKLYICGGWSGLWTLNTCEYYSPETNQWIMFTPMGSRREGLGVMAYADQLFAVGGDDCQSVLCSVEAYNLGTDTWLEVSPMFNSRSFFGIGVIDCKLFVVGGYTNLHTTTTATEYYDAGTGQWFHACDMEVDCRSLSCCVVPRHYMAMCAVPRDDLPYLHFE